MKTIQIPSLTFEEYSYFLKAKDESPFVSWKDFFMNLITSQPLNIAKTVHSKEEYEALTTEEKLIFCDYAIQNKITKFGRPWGISSAHRHDLEGEIRILKQMEK